MFLKTLKFALLILILSNPVSINLSKAQRLSNQIKETYDLIIIGGGTAALAAMIKAKTYNKKILLINNGLPIGGVSLNIGALPTKILYRITENIRKLSKVKFKGINIKRPEIDLAAIFNEKKKLVKEINSREYNKILNNLDNVTILNGWGRFIDKNTIQVDKNKYFAKNIIIATGATTDIPPINGIDKCDYLTITCSFYPYKIPESITIIGAGYLGLELSLAYARLGIKTRLIERAEYVFYKQTKDIGIEIEKSLKRSKIELIKGCIVKKISKNKNKWLLTIIDSEGQEKKYVENGNLLIATGIKGNTNKLNLNKIGLRIDNKGFVIVNDEMQTSIPNIYAIGDCVNTPSFACIGGKEAKVAVNNIFEKHKIKMNYDYFPWVAFTNPQIGGTGLDEIEAQKRKINYDVVIVNLKEIPKSEISKESNGFIKLIRDKDRGVLIGARVLANEVGELTTLLSFIIKHKIKISELKEALFPYLTLSEGIRIAAQAFDKNKNYIHNYIP